jgi:hypothetical protein
MLMWAHKYILVDDVAYRRGLFACIDIPVECPCVATRKK